MVRWLFALVFIISVPAFAQDEDFFEVEEPEEFVDPVPEPYYEDGAGEFEMGEEPPPPPPSPDSFGNQRPGQRPNFRPQQPRASSPPATSGEIQFNLIDPPLYYVGEKKPPLEKPRR